MKRVRGYSIIELIVVIAIGTILAVMSAHWLQAERSRSLRSATVTDQAREQATLARALEIYLDKATHLPESGAFDVTYADLRDAKLLPEGFALRESGGGYAFTSPTMRSYNLRAIKVDGRYQGAVFAGLDGNSSSHEDNPLLRKIGLTPNEQGLFEYFTLVMRKMRMEYEFPAAVVRAGQTKTDQHMSGYAVDVEALLGAVMPRPIIATLIGFSGLSTAPVLPPAGGDGSNGGGGSLDGKLCYVSNTGTCSIGYTQAFHHTACSDWGPDSTSPRMAKVALGAESIVITRDVTTTPPKGFPANQVTLDPTFAVKYPNLYVGSYSEGSGYAPLHCSKVKDGPTYTDGFNPEYGGTIAPSYGCAVMNPGANSEGLPTAAQFLSKGVTRKYPKQHQILMVMDDNYVAVPVRGSGYSTGVAATNWAGAGSVGNWTLAEEKRACGIGGVPAPIMARDSGGLFAMTHDKSTALPFLESNDVYWVESLKHGNEEIYSNFYCSGRFMRGGNITAAFPPGTSQAGCTNEVLPPDVFAAYGATLDAAVRAAASAALTSGVGRSSTMRPYSLYEHNFPNTPQISMCCK